jgi:hypothetical protein
VHAAFAVNALSSQSYNRMPQLQPTPFQQVALVLALVQECEHTQVEQQQPQHVVYMTSFETSESDCSAPASNSLMKVLDFAAPYITSCMPEGASLLFILYPPSLTNFRVHLRCML